MSVSLVFLPPWRQPYMNNFFPSATTSKKTHNYEPEVTCTRILIATYTILPAGSLCRISPPPATATTTFLSLSIYRLLNIKNRGTSWPLKRMTVNGIINGISSLFICQFMCLIVRLFVCVYMFVCMFLSLFCESPFDLSLIWNRLFRMLLNILFAYWPLGLGSILYLERLNLLTLQTS